MAPFELHLGPVLAGAGAFWVFGGLWYAGLWGKAYTASLGLDEEGLRARERVFPLALLGYFVAGLVLAFVLDNLLRMLRIEAAWDGATFGLVVWAGFVLSYLVILRLFEVRTSAWYFLHSGASAIALVGLGALLAVF